MKGSTAMNTHSQTIDPQSASDPIRFAITTSNLAEHRSYWQGNCWSKSEPRLFYSAEAAEAELHQLRQSRLYDPTLQVVDFFECRAMAKLWNGAVSQALTQSGYGDISYADRTKEPAKALHRAAVLLGNQAVRDAGWADFKDWAEWTKRIPAVVEHWNVTVWDGSSGNRGRKTQLAGTYEEAERWCSQNAPKGAWAILRRAEGGSGEQEILAMNEVVPMKSVTVVVAGSSQGDFGGGPRYAAFEINQALISKLEKIVSLCREHGLTEARVADAPNWGPAGVAEELRLNCGEMVILPGGAFWYTDSPAKEDGSIQSVSVQLAEIKAAYESSGDGDVVALGIDADSVREQYFEDREESGESLGNTYVNRG